MASIALLSIFHFVKKSKPTITATFNLSTIYFSPSPLYPPKKNLISSAKSDPNGAPLPPRRWKIPSADVRPKRKIISHPIPKRPARQHSHIYIYLLEIEDNSLHVFTRARASAVARGAKRPRSGVLLLLRSELSQALNEIRYAESVAAP